MCLHQKGLNTATTKHKKENTFLSDPGIEHRTSGIAFPYVTSRLPRQLGVPVEANRFNSFNVIHQYNTLLTNKTEFVCHTF